MGSEGEDLAAAKILLSKFSTVEVESPVKVIRSNGNSWFLGISTQDFTYIY